jgi:putative hemolysin
MNKIIQFGETVEGYNIPVLNEREIRAAAGTLFLATFVAWMFVLFNENFVPLKYVIVIFFVDLVIRVFVNPKFSPSLIIGRLIVRNQTPEYVGAAQKKFAWIIGVVLSATMFFHLIIINATSPVAGIFCLTCLAFLFFEAAFGICLGCKFYPLFFKDKVQYCPGEVCDVKSKQDIQKTSKGQLFMLSAFVALMIVTVYLLNDKFSEKPYDLLGINNTDQSENTANTQIENPASANCIEKGGKLSIVDEPAGQVGMCTFSDGTVCEEWAYFRGECQKSKL